MIALGPGRYFGEVVTVRRVGHLLLTATRYRAGEVLPTHFHERPYLFTMFVGSVIEHTMGREHVCSRGSLIYNEAGESHRDHIAECGAVGLNVELSGARAAELRREGAGHEPLLYHHAGPAIHAVGILQRAAFSDDPLSHLGIEEAVTHLLDSLSGQVKIRRGRPPWLGKVESFIRHGYLDGLELGIIAPSVRVHPAHLCREFRRGFGCTMTEYAARLRADRALSDIMASDAPLATVAAQAGYADQSHMSRAIRKYFGTTPGQLRHDSGGMGTD